MRSDLIRRQDAIDALIERDPNCGIDSTEVIKELPSAQPEPQWIPVKFRPMDTEEREYWEEQFGVELADEDAVMFDCPMPKDGQCVWITTKDGYLFQDVVEEEDGMFGLDVNGDWDDIVAWMPVYQPKPYKEESEEKHG